MCGDLDAINIFLRQGEEENIVEIKFYILSKKKDFLYSVLKGGGNNTFMDLKQYCLSFCEKGYLMSQLAWTQRRFWPLKNQNATKLTHLIHSSRMTTWVNQGYNITVTFVKKRNQNSEKRLITPGWLGVEERKNRIIKGFVEELTLTILT